MATNRTRRTRASQILDHWKIDQLLTGEPGIAGTGYAAAFSHGCNHWTEDMWQAFSAAIAADWAQHGAEFMAWWRGDTERFSAVYAAAGGKRRDPSITPWALIAFGEPAALQPQGDRE